MTTTTVPLFRLSTRAVSVGKLGIRMSSTMQYQHAKIGPFTQPAPVLENQFDTDPILSRILKRLLPAEHYNSVADDLSKFGNRIVKEVDALGFEAEVQEPYIQQFDAWGNRVDNLVVAPAWNKLKSIAAEEGLIGIGYNDSVDAEVRRVHQMAKLYMFHPSSGLVSCPLAMTDGAAKTIRELNLASKHPEVKEAYDRLVSRDPSYAWTSGQWMTEKAGGSDVGGGCDTYAKHVDGDVYKLSGYKWFSSAVDADMSLTLARSVDDNGNAQTGSRGLSLFFLRVRDSKTGKLNGLQMLKLKNKLGTRQLPTAELLLDGVEARKVSEEGRGVSSIANMLNITRIHNALASAASIRRIVSLARDYATRRVAFGKKLVDWPLHLNVLAQLEVQARASLLMTMEATRLLGLSESGRATELDLLLLRLVTPITKLHVGKVCIPAVSEGIECFGGQGYIEDTGIPVLLRDAQVTAIWEGTTNVLSLDVLRVFATTKFAAAEAYGKRISEIIAKTKGADEKVAKAGALVEKALGELLAGLKSAQKSSDFPNNLQRGARDIGMSMGNIYTAALLVEFAAHPDATDTDKDAAFRYAHQQKLTLVTNESFDGFRNEFDRAIIYENYSGFSKL